MQIAITGANRGIGFEFVRQYLARGEAVTALVREPKKAEALQTLQEKFADKLKIFDCDVESDASVEKLVDDIKDPIDILINNAGVRIGVGKFDEFQTNEALKTYAINALGPLRVSRALLPRVLASATKKIFHITSKLGSISDVASPGEYAYRMSKAALNMGSRVMAVEFKSEKLISIVIGPGWVQTDMGGPGAPLHVRDSVSSMLKTFDQLGMSHSGGFYNYAGEEIPW